MEAELDQEGGGLRMRKWNDSRGETLVEVLAAILIASLSVTLIFGAIMPSTTMDHQAQDLDEKYYEVFSKAERQESGDELSVTTKVTMADKNAGAGAEKEVTVTFYGGEGAISYALGSEGGGI